MYRSCFGVLCFAVLVLAAGCASERAVDRAIVRAEERAEHIARIGVRAAADELVTEFGPSVRQAIDELGQEAGELITESMHVFRDETGEIVRKSIDYAAQRQEDAERRREESVRVEERFKRIERGAEDASSRAADFGMDLLQSRKAFNEKLINVEMELKNSIRDNHGAMFRHVAEQRDKLGDRFTEEVRKLDEEIKMARTAASSESQERLAQFQDNLRSKENSLYTVLGLVVAVLAILATVIGGMAAMRANARSRDEGLRMDRIEERIDRNVEVLTRRLDLVVKGSEREA